jgi:hypothetical protein
MSRNQRRKQRRRDSRRARRRQTLPELLQSMLKDCVLFGPIDASGDFARRKRRLAFEGSRKARSATRWMRSNALNTAMIPVTLDESVFAYPFRWDAGGERAPLTLEHVEAARAYLRGEGR